MGLNQKSEIEIIVLMTAFVKPLRYCYSVIKVREKNDTALARKLSTSKKSKKSHLKV